METFDFNRDALKAKGKIDFEKLREAKSPLLEVWEAMAKGSTWRDDPDLFLEDVKIALQARNDKHMLSKALDNLEARMEVKARMDGLINHMNKNQL